MNIYRLKQLNPVGYHFYWRVHMLRLPLKWGSSIVPVWRNCVLFLPFFFADFVTFPENFFRNAHISSLIDLPKKSFHSYRCKSRKKFLTEKHFQKIAANVVLFWLIKFDSKSFDNCVYTPWWRINYDLMV